MKKSGSPKSPSLNWTLAIQNERDLKFAIYSELVEFIKINISYLGRNCINSFRDEINRPTPEGIYILLAFARNIIKNYNLGPKSPPKCSPPKTKDKSPAKKSLSPVTESSARTRGMSDYRRTKSAGRPNPMPNPTPTPKPSPKPRYTSARWIHHRAPSPQKRSREKSKTPSPRKELKSKTPSPKKESPFGLPKISMTGAFSRYNKMSESPPFKYEASSSPRKEKSKTPSPPKSPKKELDLFSYTDSQGTSVRFSASVKPVKPVAVVSPVVPSSKFKIYQGIRYIVVDRMPFYPEDVKYFHIIYRGIKYHWVGDYPRKGVKGEVDGHYRRNRGQ